MRIRLKKKGIIKDKRLEGDNLIEDIMIKGDVTNPKEVDISIFFRGNESSGIINMKKSEAELLMKSLKDKLRDIGKVKKIKQ